MDPKGGYEYEERIVLGGSAVILVIVDTGGQILGITGSGLLAGSSIISEKWRLVDTWLAGVYRRPAGCRVVGKL